MEKLPNTKNCPEVQWAPLGDRRFPSAWQSLNRSWMSSCWICHRQDSWSGPNWTTWSLRFLLPVLYVILDIVDSAEHALWISTFILLFRLFPLFVMLSSLPDSYVSNDLFPQASPNNLFCNILIHLDNIVYYSYLCLDLVALLNCDLQAGGQFWLNFVHLQVLNKCILYYILHV